MLIVNVPERVPPVSGRFPEAIPVRLAVIVPAEKLPLESRKTPVLAVFAEVNEMLPACQALLPLT